MPIYNCGQRLSEAVCQPEGVQHQRCHTGVARPEEIVDCAIEGNASALAATRHFAHYLGLGLISATNIFNPNNIRFWAA